MNELLPLYVLVGEDAEARQREKRRLQEAACGQDEDAIERIDLSSGKEAADRLFEAANTLPFLSARRWVEASPLRGLKGDDQERLLAYIKAPSPTTVLCLEAKSIDARTKLGKTLKKLPGFKSFDLPKGRGLRDYVHELQDEFGIRLSAEAAGILAERSEDHPSSLRRAFEILSLSCPPDATRVDAEAVQDAMGGVKGSDVFAYVEAVTTKNETRALSALQRLMQDREPALRVLALLARQYRMLHDARRGARVQGPPFVVKKIQGVAQRMKPAEATEALARIAGLDIALKSSKVGHHEQMMRLTHELCR